MADFSSLDTFKYVDSSECVDPYNLDIMRERHQILYQMILDLAEEIDCLRKQVNFLGNTAPKGP
jgi:hypothetical protein